MTGRGGWSKVVFVGRPPKLPEVIRAPESWWLRECYQQDRSLFSSKASEEQPRMARFGISPDPLVWRN